MSRPSPARILDFWRGGRDNYPVDREVSAKILAEMPEPDLRLLARIRREFMGRAVLYLAAEARITQFLDIGTGLPAVDSTHQVAQRITPGARVVYVDNDPVVLAHARALLVGTPEGATDHLQADLRDVDEIVKQAAATLDLTRPVGLLLLGLLEFIPDADRPHLLVRRFMDQLAAGSYLVIGSHTRTEALDRVAAVWNAHGGTPITIRSVEAFTAFFADLELVEPGAVSQPRWRPHVGTLFAGRDLPEVYGAVGRSSRRVDRRDVR